MKYNVKVDCERYDDLDKMIRKFNEKVRKDGLLEELWERRFFESDSQKKRRKKRESKRERDRIARKKAMPLKEKTLTNKKEKKEIK